MPPRKSRTPRQSLTEPDASSISGTNGGTPSSETPTMRKAKRKVDWSTIDDDKRFKNGFRIKPIKADLVREKPTKKRRLHDHADYLQDDNAEEPNKFQHSPFEGTAVGDAYYRVEPNELWLAAQRYRKFTIQENNFAVNDIVFIRPSEVQNPDPNAPVEDWVAKVLEVRAGNEAHVYLRVYWMYRPEDLPGGRRPYHGRNELIVSNCMDVIEALSVDGRAQVIHWVEDNEKNEVLDPTQLFWRQTLDVAGGNVLSELPKHCKDEQPCNPDELLIQCDNCGKWLHGSCIEEDAVRNAYETNEIPYPGEHDKAASKSGKGRASSASTIDNPTARKKASVKKKASKKNIKEESLTLVGEEERVFSAKVEISDKGQTKLVLLDKRTDQESEIPVECLLCGELVDREASVDKSHDNDASSGISVKETKAHPKDEPSSDRSDSEQTNGHVSGALIPTAQMLPTRSKDDDADSVVGNDMEEEDDEGSTPAATSSSAVTSSGNDTESETNMDPVPTSPPKPGTPAKILGSTSAAVSAGVHSITDFFKKHSD